VQIADSGVSRQHLEVCWEKGHWWVRDLQSRNGTYLNGQPIGQMPLEGAVTLELGREGPLIGLVASSPANLSVSKPQASVEEISRRYFARSGKEPTGEHTLMIRQAFLEFRRKQSRRYWGIIGVIFVLLLGVGGVALYQHVQLKQANQIAIDIFYHMKVLELQLATVEDTLSESAKAARQIEIAMRKQQLADLRKKYEDFIERIQLTRSPLDSEAQLILRVARLFGECELNVPEDFAREVKQYIDKWKATPRLEKAIQRLNENRYSLTLSRTLTAQQLPPQFLYLALQESGFVNEIVGPKTRYGYAKGMWQFIPDTGVKYGLRLGPRQELGIYDPEDERHDFEKSTRAAARYLRDIYKTDAQASGLLVIASYNWGEGNIIRLIREMPLNPKERNFWELLRRYKIPQETYDYVLYIFSAAVIGENPKLFGFGFENPLSDSLASPL